MREANDKNVTRYLIENNEVSTKETEYLLKRQTNLEYEADSKIFIPSKTKKKYHDQRLTQSGWAFWLSIVGSIAGFIVIVWSIWRGIQINNPEWPGLVGGTVTEAISILFYSLSNKTNEKITEFFKELTKDENIKSSIKLAYDVHEQEIRDELLTKLSLHLAGIDEDKICNKVHSVCQKKENQ